MEIIIILSINSFLIPNSLIQYLVNMFLPHFVLIFASKGGNKIEAVPALVELSERHNIKFKSMLNAC